MGQKDDAPDTPRAQTTARAKQMTRAADSDPPGPDDIERRTDAFLGSLVARMGRIEQLIESIREENKDLRTLITKIRFGLDSVVLRQRQVDDGWHSLGNSVEALAKETRSMLSAGALAIDANTLAIGELLAEVGKYRQDLSRLALIEERIERVEDETTAAGQARIQSIRARASQVELELEARKAEDIARAKAAEAARAEASKHWVRWAAAALVTLIAAGLAVAAKECNASHAPRMEQRP